jgi:hypothetical protein
MLRKAVIQSSVPIGIALIVGATPIGPPPPTGCEEYNGYFCVDAPCSYVQPNFESVCNELTGATNCPLYGPACSDQYPQNECTASYPTAVDCLYHPE